MASFSETIFRKFLRSAAIRKIKKNPESQDQDAQEVVGFSLDETVICPTEDQLVATNEFDLGVIGSEEAIKAEFALLEHNTQTLYLANWHSTPVKNNRQKRRPKRREANRDEEAQMLKAWEESIDFVGDIVRQRMIRGNEQYESNLRLFDEMIRKEEKPEQFQIQMEEELPKKEEEEDLDTLCCNLNGIGLISIGIVILLFVALNMYFEYKYNIYGFDQD